LLEATEPPVVFAWRTIFGNDHPVEIEVGFGKGLFLLTSAQANPEVNYLGIEIARKYQLFTATRMAKRQLKNVRLVKADARYFLASHVASQSCQALHLYFPDPWWKKRHLKRRLVTSEFANQSERVLRLGGRLHVVTDVEEYFNLIKATIWEHTKLRLVPDNETRGLDHRTNFERKFREAGRPIYSATYER
jgi:tRNA (guanine-N7-)-methyltransferase